MAQLTDLAESEGGRLITVDLETLMAGGDVDHPGPDPLHPLIFNLPRPVEDAPSKWSSRSVIEAFGRLAARIIRRTSPKTVFLSGGDTAREVLKSLEIDDLEIRSEVSPGVVHLRAGDLSLLTKSGGFGHPTLLSELWRRHLRPGA